VILGIDPGVAACGFALTAGAELVDVATFTTKRNRRRVGDAQVRLDEVLAAIEARVTTEVFAYLELAVVEWPIVGGRRGDAGRASSSSASALTFAAAGAIYGLLRGWDVRVLRPPPQSWRHRWMGCRASGDATQRRIEATYHVTETLGKVRAPHACDAIGLSLYGAKMLAIEAAKASARRAA